MPDAPGTPGTGGGDAAVEPVPNPDLDVLDPVDVEPDLVDEDRPDSPADFSKRSR